MNALLIHNDNLPTKLISKFDHSAKFIIGSSHLMQDGFSFDRFAHEFLEKYLFPNQYDAIFIPYSLSLQNYLELSGVRLALHIRLSPEFKHARVPIVFIGHESKEQIAKITEFDSFLFTVGVFATRKFEYESLQEIFNWIMGDWKSQNESALISEQKYRSFLDKIKIEPPSNYRSHHSVDNELALLNWSEYLKCDQNIPEVKLNISTGLYFKFEKAKKPLRLLNDGKNYLIKVERRTKVLLIDDEAEKGWALFYRAFFKNSPNIIFEYLDIDYRLYPKTSIVKEAERKIESFDPDILILDLRLSDSDFDDKADQLSGVEILKLAKRVNRGIQVIITTASNKALVYQSVLNNGADFYVFKNGVEEAYNSIHNLHTALGKAGDKALKLKPLCKSFGEIKENSINESFSFRENISRNLNICFELLMRSFEEEKYLNYAYLQLFLIVEEFIHEKLVREHYGGYTKHYVCCGSNRFLVHYSKENIIDGEKKKHGVSAIKFKDKNYELGISEYSREIDTFFKMSAILLFRFGKKTTSWDWRKVNFIRNTKAAHYTADSSKIEKGTVDFKDIQGLTNFLEKILDEKNIDPIDSKYALENPV